MFGIGPLELLVVAVVAIVVVGPQRLPELMRKFGKLFVQLRRQTHEIRTGFNDVIRDAERELELEKIKELKSKLDNVKDGKVVENAIKEAVGMEKVENEYHDSHYKEGEFQKGDHDDGYIDADTLLAEAQKRSEEILRPKQPHAKQDTSNTSPEGSESVAKPQDLEASDLDPLHQNPKPEPTAVPEPSSEKKKQDESP